MDELTEKDIEGLPAKLIAQLSTQGRKKNTIETTVISILERTGEASLDRLLIEIYRDTGKIQNRAPMMMLLHRMAGNGLIEKCGKSLYRMPQPPNNQTGN